MFIDNQTRQSKTCFRGQFSVNVGLEGFLVVKWIPDKSTSQPEAFVMSKIQTVSSHKFNQPARAAQLGDSTSDSAHGYEPRWPISPQLLPASDLFI